MAAQILMRVGAVLLHHSHQLRECQPQVLLAFGGPPLLHARARKLQVALRLEPSLRPVAPERRARLSARARELKQAMRLALVHAL